MKEVAARGVRVPNTPWIRQWTRMSLQDVMDCPPDSKKERKNATRSDTFIPCSRKSAQEN